MSIIVRRVALSIVEDSSGAFFEWTTAVKPDTVGAPFSADAQHITQLPSAEVS